MRTPDMALKGTQRESTTRCTIFYSCDAYAMAMPEASPASSRTCETYWTMPRPLRKWWVIGLSRSPMGNCCCPSTPGSPLCFLLLTTTGSCACRGVLHFMFSGCHCATHWLTGSMAARQQELGAYRCDGRQTAWCLQS